MYIIILVVALVFSGLVVILVKKFPGIKIVFQVIYAVAIVILGYLLFVNILKPIAFKKERIKRETAAIERLKDIRTIEIAYKDRYGKYVDNFDALIGFVKKDSFQIKKLYQVKPWDQDEITKEEALKTGILREIDVRIPVKDSIFNKKNYPIDEIRFIPYANSSQFVLGASELETGSKIKVKVFEAYALYDILFNGMDKQMIINYIDERYKITNFEGVKVGSLKEVTNNAGNWEK